MTSKLLSLLVSTGLMATVAAGCKSNNNKADDKRPPAAELGPDCDAEIDKARYPDKHATCMDCEKQHRGMGSMETDCKKAIEKPWK